MDDRACSLGTGVLALPALLPPQSTSGSVGQNIHAFQEARENEFDHPDSVDDQRGNPAVCGSSNLHHIIHQEVEALGLLVTTSAQRQLQLQNHWRTGYENGVEYELLVPRGLVQPTGVIFPAWETP
ncbi:hypothetical protein BD779DRAFT_1476571 [Infundibulicybe gibba]|nr:hypothetical protein BD779DRAFT_1476571 [Infundibulicybe gibba]